ncbi:hypothetical protein KY338_02700 [Candidatus Woesearchaeota archaeon]|nr:hypothetical protein [Candidatus Woesearchaeota archaeon]MBW3005731.1 hypothetical protein [Candidatus Woesearchaeota archaeon]
MRCTKHRRQTVGACNWCGKQLCPYCIGKKEGGKLYCDKCAMRLSTVKRAKIPKPEKPKKAPGARAQPVIEEKPTQQKKVFSVDEEGYLILEQ